MNRAFCSLVGCLTLYVATTFSSSASGLIIVHEKDFWRRPPPGFPWPSPPQRPIRPPRAPIWAPLENRSTKVDVQIRNQIARTTINQQFYNPNATQLEGTFLFPVPKGAHISRFSMEINGRLVEAELLPAKKAGGIYRDIVRKLRDPALLEYVGRDLVKVRIFPIEPHATKRIKLVYSQLLPADNGLVSFQFPLNTERVSAKPIQDLSIKIDLESKQPLKSIYSPSHSVEIKRRQPRTATIGYEASQVKTATDFQLFYSEAQREIGVSLLTHREGEKDGYFVLLASPGQELRNIKVIPKDVVFVLDTSGSMAGSKLDQAKKALAFCVENLNNDDRFQLLRFSTEVEPLFSELVDASKENRRRAQTFVENLKPVGGTAINDALANAMNLQPGGDERPYVVIFLTDGRPTVGPTRENEILGNFLRTGKSNVRVFCFGIGTDVNTHLLDKITEKTRASSTYVLPEEDLEVKVSNFFTRIKEPVLANPTITFPKGVKATKLHPSTLPDLFRGEQLVLTGRYQRKGRGIIEIVGTVNGETKKFTYPVDFPETSRDHEFIPRLWATRRVGYLLDEMRLHGKSDELKKEITELARTYSIVTPYTAYLIVEDERDRDVAQESRSVHFLDSHEEQAARGRYEQFMQAKSGAAAVAGARSYSTLKSANAAGDAVLLGNAEARYAQRGQPVPRVPSAGPVPAPRSSRPVKASPKRRSADQYQAQSRFVGGKTFYRNKTQWLDPEVQKFPDANKIRVQLGSESYFKLLQKHPRIQAWLALGSNVVFVLDGKVYEVFP